MYELEIREATLKDLEGIWEVHTSDLEEIPEQEEEAFSLGGPWNVKRLLKEHLLYLFMTGGKAVVAIAEGKVVAEVEYFLSEDLELGRNLYLDIFWAHASYRRKGIGKRLFKEIEELGREGGAERIVVWPDPDAKQFYEKLGMKKIYEVFMIEMSSVSKKEEIKERSFFYEEIKGMKFVSPAIYSSLASWSKLFERDLCKAFYGISEGCYFGLKLPPKTEAPPAFCGEVEIWSFQRQWLICFPLPMRRDFLS